eukprot:scaffold15456_cov62-Phaeocystis_antarctica.AAC.3
MRSWCWPRRWPPCWPRRCKRAAVTARAAAWVPRAKRPEDASVARNEACFWIACAAVGSMSMSCNPATGPWNLCWGDNQE